MFRIIGLLLLESMVFNTFVLATCLMYCVARRSFSIELVTLLSAVDGLAEQSLSCVVEECWFVAYLARRRGYRIYLGPQTLVAFNNALEVQDYVAIRDLLCHVITTVYMRLPFLYTGFVCDGSSRDCHIQFSRI